ncbi:hypothetical protein D9758_005623 [Tetrapyrgos nigripes]|uniref:Uncharacterized protein n=1 Tax=Tetrapyrgos nigripes TaxID=182062 RepID=A0A8H5GGU4_9AGAR|nr:hypothetical protein D9758_005623 [Tetrapyrgos nigripes]
MDLGKLSPATTLEIEITIYVLLFSAGMLVWDGLSHLGDDYRMLVRCRWQINTPMLVYYLSRFSAIGLLVTALMMGPARTEIDCHIAGIFLEVFFFLVIGTTTGLFALRVRAVYNGHRVVQAIFFALWLGTTGSCLVVFFVLDSASNPDKGVSSCLLVEKTIALGVIIAISAMLHDTAVFLAISYQMYRFFRFSEQNQVPKTTKAVKFFAPGSRDLPPLMRSLVHEGQLYYLISLFWETLVVILLIIPGIGPYYRCFMLPAHLVIVNSIACLVFRNVRLGKFREEAISYRNNTASNTFSSIGSSMDIEGSQGSDSIVFARNTQAVTMESVLASKTDSSYKNSTQAPVGSQEWTIDVSGSRRSDRHPPQTVLENPSGSIGE